MIRSTMGDFPLTINAILRHGRRVHAKSELACVVADRDVDPADLQVFPANRVAKWQVPESWAFVDGIPKTSVGKFDKLALRTQYEKGELTPTRV